MESFISVLLGTKSAGFEPGNASQLPDLWTTNPTRPQPNKNILFKKYCTVVIFFQPLPPLSNHLGKKSALLRIPTISLLSPCSKKSLLLNILTHTQIYSHRGL
jgi:hypothetical protein